MRGKIPSVLIDIGIFLGAASGTYLAQIADRPITAVLIYLSGVIVVAVHSGLLAAIVAAVAASFVYNFLLSEPVFQFGVTTADEAVPLIAFNATALLMGTLVGRLRDSASRASLAQSETAFLLTVSDRLQRALKVEDIESAIRDLLPRQSVRWVKIFILHEDVYLRTSTGEVELIANSPSALDLIQADQSLVELELTGARGTLGLARFKLEENTRPSISVPDLSSISALVALAIERCLLLEELTEALARARSEVLKDSLLSSVSHDLRTPITVIEAAAGALASPQIPLPDNERANLLTSIIEQCHRLDRYTSELLDVGRIQAGISQQAMQVVDMIEIAALAVRQVKTLHPDIQIERQVSGNSFLISANPAMVEQAIFNVLDNAGKYASSAPVSMVLRSSAGFVDLYITDDGDGIHEPTRSRIFERFYKGDGAVAAGGNGLGLFIARGFVEACGGSILVESPITDGRGTRITFQFPTISSGAQPSEPVE